jgi:putative transposase
MSRYRRVYQVGGCYFFTVVTHERRKILDQPENLKRLGMAFRRLKAAHPFTLDAFVILPDHLYQFAFNIQFSIQAKHVMERT